MDNTMSKEINGKLERAAAFIIETGARETTTGHYYIYPDEIPEEIISPRLFRQYSNNVVDVLKQYEAIGDIEVMLDGTIDIIIYLDYCPNYEPDADEREDYPDDRAILDPLQSRRVNETTDGALAEPGSRPTLAERLNEGKRKAAQQDSVDKAGKTKKRGARE